MRRDQKEERELNSLDKKLEEMKRIYEINKKQIAKLKKRKLDTESIVKEIENKKNELDRIIRSKARQDGLGSGSGYKSKKVFKVLMNSNQNFDKNPIFLA